MIFMVKRTSNWDMSQQPCENTFPMKLTRVDKRVFKSEEEYNNRFPDKWTDTGTNHRILEDGCIARDVGEEDCWGIEINTLEELIKFYEDVGEELVLGKTWLDRKTLYLEIYDDYRE